MIDKDLIEDWISIDFDVEEIDAGEGGLFHLVARTRTEDRKTVNLVCQADDPERLLVGRAMTFEGEHQAALKQLPNDVFADFFFKLLRDIVLRGLRVSVEHDGQQLHRVVMHKTVWNEALTRQTLFDAVEAAIDGGYLTSIHSGAAINTLI